MKNKEQLSSNKSFTTLIREGEVDIKLGYNGPPPITVTNERPSSSPPPPPKNGELKNDK